MLTELSIKNFAIIDQLRLTFEEGLTVLTGETGAGKSIIIDAISLLIGGRGSSEFVRHGCDRAEIEGLFTIEDRKHPCITKAKEIGIEINDGMVIFSRNISKSGKSICRINGKLVTLALLRELGQTLVDIHGQHEHQSLVDAEQHLKLLDSFAEKEISASLSEYQEIYKRFNDLTKQLNQLNEDEQKMAHRLDLIQFQLEEIKKSDLDPSEEENLLEEKYKISNFEKLFNNLNGSYEALSGEQKGLDWIGLAMSHLEEISTIDNDIKQLHENATNCFYLLEEVSTSIRSHLEMIEYDPDRLNFIQSRLNEINFLKKKYGETVEDILEYAAEIEDEIDKIKNRDIHVEKIKEAQKEILEDLMIEASNLSKLRQKCAHKLTDLIQNELKELYMEKTRFYVQFLTHEGNNNKDPEINGKAVKFRRDGIDNVQFLISTNPGEPLKPLSKVASGGELSRIMLAVKSIFSKHQGVTSIIFDEVDTGVSGRVAQAIAEKIHRISVGSQVFCITHLPQVAAMADTHFLISKKNIENRVVTEVSPLSNEEIIKEIARMISGVEITELTKEHAKELILLAKEIKK